MKKNEFDRVLINDVLDFYATSGRDTLIWRKKITPYRILVSEVMLQQTQVVRVIPKFETWMKKYPTLRALSGSNLQDILILWQGLGYQRRAKALLVIAKSVRRMPKSFDELLLLPGVGTYTASAIMAFAYNIFSHPVLETNIRTVLIEYCYRNDTSVKDSQLYDVLLRLEKYDEVTHVGARNWYYALMDFGAHLKEENISHNTKSAHHKVQSRYKGSLRELRAKTLFAVAHKKTLPTDERVSIVINQLLQEDFIRKQGSTYILREVI